MRPLSRNTNRLIYSLLLILCIVGFWWFENFYTPDPYGSGTAGDSAAFPEAYLPAYPNGERVDHDYYILSYSERHEQAAWVAYTLELKHLTYDDRKRPFFVEDPKVRSKSAGWTNYKGSGFDRGHLCPAGDRRFSEKAYNQTFYTSNVSPQNPEFNAGVWNDLEKQVRRWCKRYGTLRVITGGILTDGLPSIGEEGVSVPEYFFKVVIRENGGAPEVLGFLFQNRPSDGSPSDYLVPLDRIESVSGLDFFPTWETQQQEVIESTVRDAPWEF